MIKQIPKPKRNTNILVVKNQNRENPTPTPIKKDPYKGPIVLASDSWPDIYLNAKVQKMFDQQNKYYSSSEGYYGGKALNMKFVDIGNSIGRLDSWMVKHFKSRKSMEEGEDAEFNEELHKDLSIRTKEKYKIGEESELAVGTLPNIIAGFRQYPEILATIQTPPFSQMDTTNKVDTIFVMCPPNTPVELKGKITFLLQSMIYNLVSKFEVDDYTPFSYFQTRGIIDNDLFGSDEFTKIREIQKTSSQYSEQFQDALNNDDSDKAKEYLLKENDCLDLMFKEYEKLFNSYGVELSFKGLQIKTSPAGKEKSLFQNPELGVLLPPTKAMMHYKDFYKNDTSAGEEVRKAWDIYLNAFEQVLDL